MLTTRVCTILYLEDTLKKPASQETFVRRHSVSSESSKELEFEVDFEYLSKGEMADAPFNMSQRLSSNPGQKH